MRLTSEKQIPAKIQRYAESNHLGTPRIVYETKSGIQLHFIVGAAAILIGGLIFATYLLLYNSIFSWWPTWKSLMIAIVGIGWLGIGLWIFLTPFFIMQLSIYLCPKGLIYTRGRSLTPTNDVIRWEQLTQIAKSICIGKHNTVTIVYRLQRNDLRSFDLPDELPYMDRLYGFIEQEITRQLLPQAINALRTANTQIFGELQLTPKGIGIQHGRQILPWQECEKLVVDDTTINIFRTGNPWVWYTLSISDVPNVRILQNLVAYIVSGQMTRGVTPQPDLAAIQTPEILAFEAGYTVFFGKIGIHKMGVSVDGSEKHIPWPEIAGFAITETDVILKRQAGTTSTWHTCHRWQIRNVETLQQLFDYALNTNSRQVEELNITAMP